MDKHACSVIAFNCHVYGELELAFKLLYLSLFFPQPETGHHTFASRETAVGLCDPWVDHTMDINLPEKQELRPKTARGEEEEEKAAK